MNQNWKLSTTTLKNIKTINKLKKGVLIKYIPYSVPKSTFKPIKSEINLKSIFDYIKMRIEFLNIEQASTYDTGSDSMVPVCCICLDKIHKKNYVCTSTSCISEFLKELTNDKTYLSKKKYDYYTEYMYDYDAYNSHVDCMDAYDEHEEERDYDDGRYCSGCGADAGSNFMGACNECGTCPCGGCIDVCRCYNDEDE